LFTFLNFENDSVMTYDLVDWVGDGRGLF